MLWRRLLVSKGRGYGLQVAYLDLLPTAAAAAAAAASAAARKAAAAVASGLGGCG